jgi:hypothetical protein
MNENSYLSLYQKGKHAFERGNYRESIDLLESALVQIKSSSFEGGELQMWLVTAYQAANRHQDSIILARKLTDHPFGEIRKKSKQLLYVLEAPKLKRPVEWSSSIPDIEFSEDKILPGYITKAVGKTTGKVNRQKVVEEKKYPIGSLGNDSFVWVALLVCLVGIGGYLFLGVN